MLKEYKIKVLSNEDYDNLPYKHAKTSLGCADPVSQTAYIRNTGVPAIDQSTMQHELEELLATVSPHEEDGIRYKKAMDIFRPLLAIASVIPGPHQPFAIAANLADTGVQIHDRGFQPLDALALAGPVSGFAKGLSSTGNLMGGFKGSLGMFPTSASIATPSNYGGSVTVPGVQQSVPFSSISKAGGTNIVNPTAGLSSSLSKQATQAIQAARDLTPVQRVTGALKDLAVDTGKDLAVGAATNALTGRGQVTAPQGALARFAPSNLQTRYDSGEYTPAVSQDDLSAAFQNIDRNAALRTRDIFDRFRVTAPGATPEGNTAFARALSSVGTGSSAEKQQFATEAEQANKNKELQYRYSKIRDANKLNDERMKFYIDLANKPDDEVRRYVQNDINQFRTTFKPLGGISWS